MAQNDPGSGFRSRHDSLRFPRRAALFSLAGGGLILLGAAGSRLVRSAPPRQSDATPDAASSPEATPAPFTAQVFAGEGFVGEAENVPAGDAFVAIVVADAKPGTEAREARAIIYGDTENEIQEWFPGTAVANRLDLVSEDGARFEGEFNEEGASGTVTLADGTALPFTAVPSTGVAGLYTVTLFPDGRVEGTSETGARLQGQVQDDPEEEGVYPLVGTITPVEGNPREFQVDFLFMPETEPINARFIVLPDGRMKGGARRASGKPFTCPLLI